jgi:hypothetical protein
MFRFDLGPRDSHRNSGVNRTEINRDPQQAEPTDLNVNVNKSSNSVRRRRPLNIVFLEEDDKALNAIAARGISWEREALKNNNPKLPSQVDQRSQSSTPTPGAHSRNLSTQQQPLEMRNNLPPRLQALNNMPGVDSQVPPRYPSSNSIPPRFQTSQISAPPGKF